MDNVAHPPVPACPYVGLQPYTEAEREYFFGREQDTQTIAANLLTAPLTLLYGASGVGKTSVLAAGVVPYLRAMPDVVVVQFRTWQDSTFQVVLMDAIAGEIYRTTDQPFYLDQPLALDEFLARAARQTKRTLLIILDQFEEYFLYHPAADPFDEQFARAVNRGDVHTNFLLSLREDALSQLDRFETRIPNLMSNYLRLEHLDPQGAESAIRKPLDVFNAKRSNAPPITVEDALVDALIDQVQTGRVTLGQAGQGDVATALSADARIETPFLQMVLTRLWEDDVSSELSSPSAKGERGLGLRLETLNRLGGAEKIVRTHLDLVMKELRASEQEICSTFFDRLVTPSGTKVAQNADDLVAYAACPAAQVKPVLKKLADARVLRAVAPPLDRPQTARYEIFHDVIAPAVLDWRRRFVERKRARRFRLAFLGTALLVLVFACCALTAAGATIRALSAERDALDQRDVAAAQANARSTARAEAVTQMQISDARRLAAQAASNRESEFDLALLLGVEALRIDNNLDTRSNLYLSLTSKPRLITFLRSGTGYVYGVAFSPDGKMIASTNTDRTVTLWDVNTRQIIGQRLTGHENPVNCVAFSPDGKLLASGSDSSAILWDVSTRQAIGQPLKKESHNDARSVAFSPNGKILAVAGYEEITLWDVSTHRPIGQPFATDGYVNGVAFSPDGRLLASSNYSKVMLWDAITQEPVGQPLLGHHGYVTSVAFSPDGKTLASASDDQTIILWNVSTQQPIGQPLTGHKSSVRSVAFSPDGRTLASASYDSTVIWWNVTTHQPIGQPLTGHKSSVYSVSFSPDGNTLVSGGNDGVILWDVSMRQSMGQPLTGQKSGGWSLVFSPDGRTLASTSGVGVITLFDMVTRQPLGQPLTGDQDTLVSIAYSPDGKMLASGDWRGKIVLWNMSTRQPIGQPLTKHSSIVEGLAFSPDGQMLASSSLDKTIILWDVSTHQPIGQPLAEHRDSVRSVAFSPDGKMLASGSDDHTVILWDAITHQPVGQRLSGHSDNVMSVAFSPDGRTLASASGDQTIILWDVGTRQRIGQPLAGHKEYVDRVVFSPDGRTLASSSSDQTIILWDVSTQQPILQPLRGHTDGVTGLAFSPDGKILASSGWDKDIYLWDADVNSESWITRACRIANRNLTQEEWKQYMNSNLSTYHQTCPGQ